MSLFWKQNGRSFYVVVAEHRADEILESTFKVLSQCNVKMFRKATPLGVQLTFVVPANKIEDMKKHLSEKSY